MNTSPSKLVYVEACPKFKSTPFTNDAADDGIRLHSHMEDLIQRPTDTWDEWIDSLNEPASMKAAVHDAADQIRPYAEFAPIARPQEQMLSNDCKAATEVGRYPELQIKVGDRRFGYIDLFLNMGNRRFVIVDYKFVRSPGDYELQMAAYALSVSKYLPDGFDSITAIIVAPYIPDSGNLPGMRFEYSEKDLEYYKRLIDRIDESVDDPNSDGNPGSHCEHCKFNGRCRYQASLVPAEISNRFDLHSILEPKTLEDRATRKRFTKCLDAMVTAFKDDDKRFFAENPEAELPGFRKFKNAGRATLDKSRAAEINQTILSRFPELTGNDLLESSVPDIAQLATKISLSTGESEVSAKKRLSIALDEFMTHGSSFLVFREVTTKSRLSHTPSAELTD